MRVEGDEKDRRRLERGKKEKLKGHTTVHPPFPWEKKEKKKTRKDALSVLQLPLCVDIYSANKDKKRV